MNDSGEKILLIINPKAGRSGAEKLAGKLAARLEEGGALVTRILTSEPGHARRIAFSQGADYDCLVACGGDGTLSEVIGGLMQLESRPDVGFLPVGSTCDIARTFRLPAQPRKAAQVILEGTPFPVDIGRVEGSPSQMREDLPEGVVPSDPSRLPDSFTYVASFGAFTETSYATRRRLKKTLGHLAYLLTGLQSVSRIRPYDVSVSLDGTDYSGSYIFGGVLNSFSVGGLVKLDDVLFNDGLFEVLLVKPPHNVGQTAKLLALLLRRKTGDAIIRRRASEIVFGCQEALSFTLDGEYGGSRTEWTLRNSRQAVRLRVPAAPGTRI